MTHAVLSILVMFVCLSNTLEVNRLVVIHDAVPISVLNLGGKTAPDLKASLKREIQALELKANSLKALYNTQKEALWDRIMDHLTDTASKATQRAAHQLAANEKHLETAEESSSELEAQFQQLSKDTELVWENIQKEIERANNLVRIIEVMKQEL